MSIKQKQVLGGVLRLALGDLVAVHQQHFQVLAVLQDFLQTLVGDLVAGCISIVLQSLRK